MTDLTQMPAPIYTPTEELIVDVLVARYRLGDTLWHFDSRNKPALRRLDAKHIIIMDSGAVENTVRAALSHDALRAYGARWFQLGATLGYLPDDDPFDGANDDRWSKSHLQALIDLPQFACDVDPRAVNIAHLIMIGMIQRQYPVHRVGAGVNGSVNLYRSGGRTLQVDADGKTIRLHQHGVPPRLTSYISDAVAFGEETSGGNLLRTN